LILEHKEEFLRIVREPNVVELTSNQMKAVRRLTDLGFAPGAALEAYVMAGKNEEVAAAMLFENQSRGLNPSVVVNEGFEYIDPSLPAFSPTTSHVEEAGAAQTDIFNHEIEEEEDFYGDQTAPPAVPEQIFDNAADAGEEDFYASSQHEVAPPPPVAENS
jgi:hypothetical protein